MSFDFDSHPLSSTPAQRASMAAWSPSQDDGELAHDKPIEAINHGQTHAPSYAESYAPNIVYAKEYDRANQKPHGDIPGQKQNGGHGASPQYHGIKSQEGSARPISVRNGDIPSQKHNKSHGASPQYEGIATLEGLAPRGGLTPRGGLARQISVGTQKERPSIPPDYLSRNAPSSRHQTRVEREFDEENPQDLGARGSSPAVHGSQSEDGTPRRLDSIHDWDNEATPQAQRGYRNGTNQYQASTDVKYVQRTTQDSPLPNFEAPISEDDYEDGESNVSPPKGGAASKRKTANVVRGKTREIHGNLEYNQDGEWGKAPSGFPITQNFD